MSSQNNSDGVEKAMSAPGLCEKGCGFFRNGGGLYCSKCAKEVAQQEEKQRATEASVQVSAQNIAASLQASKAQPDLPVAAPAVEAVAEPSAPSCSTPEVQVSSSAQESSTPPNPNRCFQCKKKTGLTGFKCKCNNVFCGQHRLAECHNCPFDYKTAQRAQLAEANPVVQAAKVQKI